MTRKRRRLLVLAVALGLLGGATALMLNAFQDSLVGRAETTGLAGLIQQIGAVLRRVLQALVPPPTLDVGVVPRHQHLGHRQALPDLGARVVRAVQQAVGERVLARRVFMSQGSGDQPDQGIKQGHRRQLATRNDKIAERYFHQIMPLEETLVDAFVAPRQQHQSG